jgi:hypothetical protein
VPCAYTIKVTRKDLGGWVFGKWRLRLLLEGESPSAIDLAACGAWHRRCAALDARHTRRRRCASFGLGIR